MSILKISNDLLESDCRVRPLLHDFFDRMEFPVVDVIDPLTTTYQVEKVDMGLLFDDTTNVVLAFKEQRESIIPAGTEKCHLIITSVNDISLLPGEQPNACKQDACVSTEHMSQDGGHHVKSKG